MNTWWKVADMLDDKDTTKALDRAQFGLEVVIESEMPDEVKAEATELHAEITRLKERLKAHSKHMLSKMDGVMWPVI